MLKELGRSIGICRLSLVLSVVVRSRLDLFVLASFPPPSPTRSPTKAPPPPPSSASCVETRPLKKGFSVGFFSRAPPTGGRKSVVGRTEVGCTMEGLWFEKDEVFYIFLVRPRASSLHLKASSFSSRFLFFSVLLKGPPLLFFLSFRSWALTIATSCSSSVSRFDVRRRATFLSFFFLPFQGGFSSFCR